VLTLLLFFFSLTGFLNSGVLFLVDMILRSDVFSPSYVVFYFIHVSAYLLSGAKSAPGNNLKALGSCKISVTTRIYDTLLLHFYMKSTT